MNKLINEQLASSIILMNYIYYSTYTILSIQVLKNTIKLLALQRPRDNTVSSMSKYNYYMCTTTTAKDCMC